MCVFIKIIDKPFSIINCCKTCWEGIICLVHPQIKNGRPDHHLQAVCGRDPDAGA